MVNVDDTEAQVREALRVIGHAWREPDFGFEWDSDLLQIHPEEGRPRHVILPRPVQRPHPPLFLACTSAATVERAARYGVGALILGYAGPDAVGDLCTTYHAAIAARDPADFVSPGVSNDHVAALCPTLVLDDGDLAMRVGSAGQRFFAEANTYWVSGPAELPRGSFVGQPDILEYMDRRAADKSFHVWSIFNRHHAYGTPETAIEYVERLQATGVDEVLCLMQMGGISHEQIMESLRHWGESIIPHFRDSDATRATPTGVTA